MHAGSPDLSSPGPFPTNGAGVWRWALGLPPIPIAEQPTPLSVTLPSSSLGSLLDPHPQVGTDPAHQFGLGPVSNFSSFQPPPGSQTQSNAAFGAPQHSALDAAVKLAMGGTIQTPSPALGYAGDAAYGRPSYPQSGQVPRTNNAGSPSASGWPAYDLYHNANAANPALPDSYAAPPQLPQFPASVMPGTQQTTRVPEPDPFFTAGLPPLGPPPPLPPGYEVPDYEGAMRDYLTRKLLGQDLLTREPPPLPTGDLLARLLGM